MRDTNSNLPPSSVLDALRQPRRPQLHDRAILDLLRQWRRRGQPIEYGDLNQVADIIAPGGEPDAATRRRIVAAVEAAGIQIHNWDGFRQWCEHHTGGLLPSLTAEAMFAMEEEHRWRWPEEYDAQPPAPEAPEWLKELRRKRHPSPQMARQNAQEGR